MSPRTIVRVLLGSAMVFAGVAHLTFLRSDFDAQVPSWFPLPETFTVVASGVVEIALGAAFALWHARRREVGLLLAVFYVVIFPGNIGQYVEGVSAFGLDTDAARYQRLFFQPVLVLLALWGGESLRPADGVPRWPWEKHPRAVVGGVVVLLLGAALLAPLWR